MPRSVTAGPRLRFGYVPTSRPGGHRCAPRRPESCRHPRRAHGRARADRDRTGGPGGYRATHRQRAPRQACRRQAAARSTCRAGIATSGSPAPRSPTSWRRWGRSPHVVHGAAPASTATSSRDCVSRGRATTTSPDCSRCGSARGCSTEGSWWRMALSTTSPRPARRSSRPSGSTWRGPVRAAFLRPRLPRLERAPAAPRRRLRGRTAAPPPGATLAGPLRRHPRAGAHRRRPPGPGRSAQPGTRRAVRPVTPTEPLPIPNSADRPA